MLEIASKSVYFFYYDMTKDTESFILFSEVKIYFSRTLKVKADCGYSKQDGSMWTCSSLCKDKMSF